MFLVDLAKVACVSGFLAHVSYAADPTNQSRPRPSATGFAADFPRPTGKWISPEYKWFFEYPLPIPPTKSKKYTYTNSSTAIDYYEIELKSFQRQIYPDLPATDFVGYDGISPGPTFVMQKGREAVVRFTNNGPTNMSAHVHGQWNRAPFDGWAGDYATPGQYKDYYYPNGQSARTLWYHDHTEYATGYDNFIGQHGMYLITDAEEQALGLPAGNHDVGLLIGSKVYNQDGSLNYDTNSNAGLWGDVIEVNGQPWPYLNVEPRKYRFRLLDGAVSRTFDLSLHEGLNGSSISFDIIASDGGLFTSPVNTDDIAISMGERYEIIVDFSGYAGQNITMLNAQSMGENIDYAATNMVMRFVVGQSVTDSSNNGAVPSHLNDIPPLPTDDPVKDFTFARTNGEWQINGVGFSDVEHRILTRPPLGDDEVWTLHNGGGGGTHPVHIHLVDFKILSRTGGRNTVLPYESAGLKDVVWLAAGETVQVAARYAPWEGVYMFHCHNLVHEDHDMLVAFNVTQLANWGYDNDTIFIDPMQQEFRPKDYNEADYTEDAIMQKIAWFYSTNAYNHGNVDAVYSALDAYSTSGGQASSQTSSTVQASQPTTAQTVTSGNSMSSVTEKPRSSWTILPSSFPSSRSTVSMSKGGKGAYPTKSS